VWGGILCGFVFWLVWFFSLLHLTHNFVCRMWMELVVFTGLLTPLSDVSVFLVLFKLMEKRR